MGALVIRREAGESVDDFIGRVVDASGDPTPEQIAQLRSLLPPVPIPAPGEHTAA